MVRNFFNYLRYLPKSIKLTLYGSLAAFLIAAPFAASAGWAPDRPVKDYNNLADRVGFDHPVFNSFINTPSYGDERAFFDGRDASIPATTPGGFLNDINVEGNGQELVLRTYIHNNANQQFNESGQGVAHNTKVRVTLPTATDRAMRATSYISADNATPQAVSDTLDLVNEIPFAVEYVPGSARADTAAANYQLADSIVSSGAPVGFTGPNGDVPGCFDFDILVTFKVKVKVADFSISKQVRKTGDSDKTFKESVTVNPGDEVDYLIEVKNTGNAEIRNLAVGDKLPAHTSYVTGSTQVATNLNPNGGPYNDNITTGGIDIGHYSPGANAFILFKAKVTPNLEELQCGMNSLINKAVAQPEGMGPKEDTAEVKVNRECEVPICEVNCVPPQQPPVTPLPVTGPGETALGLLGSGGLGVAIRSYLRSRKGLAKALLLG